MELLCAKCQDQPSLAWDELCADCKAASMPPDPKHIGVGCGRGIVVYVERSYGYRAIVTTCGSTSPSGCPDLCEICEPKYAGRAWRKEAEDAGETWEEDS